MATAVEEASCSNATEFQLRIDRSVGSDGLPTPELFTLRGKLDSVVSNEQCDSVVNALSSESFVPSLGYESTNYKASVGYSGLDLNQLSKNDNMNSSIMTKSQYEDFLTIRESVRSSTERALNLCPGTLFVHYTQISQKTLGGKHHPHADNCYYTFQERTTGDNNSGVRTTPVCDEKQEQQHPWPMRIAASILYLNDDGFRGGEFYWADWSTGEPSTIVPAKQGRMTYFTSGPENLHGATPVLELESEGTCSVRDVVADDDINACRVPRRLALAMWYTTLEEEAESTPKYGTTGGDRDKKDAPKPLFEIPVRSLERKGALRLALGLYLLGQQNTPTKASWRLQQGADNENVLTMLFKDHTAMISITLRDNDPSSPAAIVVERHVDKAAPSLQYQLQESVLLHGVLDELEKLAIGEKVASSDNVKEEDRLIRLRDGGAIEKARDTLPARRA